MISPANYFYGRYKVSSYDFKANYVISSWLQLVLNEITSFFRVQLFGAVGKRDCSTRYMIRQALAGK